MVNCVKGKQRNVLKVNTLESILRVRIFLQDRGGGFKQFIVATDMLELFNSSMYNNKDNPVDINDRNHINEVVELLPGDIF